MSRHQIIYEILKQYGQEEKFEKINSEYELDCDQKEHEINKKETQKANIKDTKDYMWGNRKCQNL